MRAKRLDILNYYVDTYRLEIETLSLLTTSHSAEHKFLYNLKNHIEKLICILDTHIVKIKLYNNSFVDLKKQLEISLARYKNFNHTSTPSDLYKKFQTLLNNIEQQINITA